MLLKMRLRSRKILLCFSSQDSLFLPANFSRRIFSHSPVRTSSNHAGPPMTVLPWYSTRWYPNLLLVVNIGDEYH
jgi:hypothetical protein